MALDWAGATVGVTQSGIETIKEQIRTDYLSNARNALSDSDAVVTAVAKTWSGSDATRFLENFGIAVESANNAIQSYENQINMMLDEVFADWKAFQDKNVT